MSVSVRTLLNEKVSTKIFFISKEATIFEAIKTMVTEDIGALIVVDNNVLVGIVSERDCSRKGQLEGRDPHLTTVGEIMVTDVVIVTPTETINDCMAKMKKNNIRHLPVLEGKKVVGLLSMKDVVYDLLTEQQHKINILEQRRSAKGYGADL